MRKVTVCCGLIVLLLAGNAMAATEEAKDLAIANGLAWLASTQTVSGAEGYWSYPEDGTLAATASAALAFVDSGYLPGDGSIYDAVVTRALTYIFNRATVDGRFGVETAGYTRYAEDYNNDGVYDDGNDEAIYFEPGASTRRVYTSGIVAPVVYALGESLGTNIVVGMGSGAISGKTYAQAMQDIADWFSWAQVEPDRGNYRGGWRYDANYSTSDNSTAQWGALPLLYAQAWGLGVSQYVYNELTLWVNYIQNPNGGSGYTSPTTYVNVSKTGGLLLELAAIGALDSDTRVTDAVAFINSRWNTFPSGTWYGNLNHPYAMWAVYKGLQIYGYLVPFACGPVNIEVGERIPAAPGGFTICFDASPATSAAGDWYSHYCDYLVGIQNVGGSWTGYSYFTGVLATGWYINILQATRVPRVITVELDIKPTSCPNPLNTKSNGVLPVAILGTDEFDVTEVDPSSVTLEGVSPLRWAYEDVATPFEGELCDCHELGPDGYMDLTLKFATQEIVTELGAVTDGEYRPLILGGETHSGALIDGEDCVWIKHKVQDPPPPPPPPTIFVETFSGASTTIHLSLGVATEVSMVVYDVRGKRVKTVLHGTLSSGDHTVPWNGRDDDDNAVANGVYFCQVKAGTVEKTVKMLLVK